jgi:hypothetical protein
VAKYLNKRAHAAFLSTSPLDKGDAYLSIALRETLVDLNRSLQKPSSDPAATSPRSPRISVSSLKKMRRGTAAGALIFINLKLNTVVAAATGGMVVALGRSSGVLRKTSDFTAIVDCRRQRQDGSIVTGLIGPDCEADVIGGSASLGGPSEESLLVMSGGLLDLISISDATCLATCLNDQRLEGINISNQIIQQASVYRSQSRSQESDSSIVAFSLTHPKSQSSKNSPEIEKQSKAKQRWRLVKCWLRFRFLRSRSLLQAWSTIGKQLLKQAEANARKAEERAWLENEEVIEVARNGAIRRSSQGAVRMSEGNGRPSSQGAVRMSEGNGKPSSQGAVRMSEGNGRPSYIRVSAGGIGRRRVSQKGSELPPKPEISAALHLTDIALATDRVDHKTVQDQAKSKPKLPVPAKKVASLRSNKSQISLRGLELSVP